MAAELTGPRLARAPRAGPPARLSSSTVYGADGNISSTRTKPRLAKSPADAAFCVTSRARAVRSGAARPAVVSAHFPVPRTSVGRRQQAPRPLSTLSASELKAQQLGRQRARPWWIQPGQHDGAACGGCGVP